MTEAIFLAKHFLEQNRLKTEGEEDTEEGTGDKEEGKASKSASGKQSEARKKGGAGESHPAAQSAADRVDKSDRAGTEKDRQRSADDVEKRRVHEKQTLKICDVDEISEALTNQEGETNRHGDQVELEARIVEEMWIEITGADGERPVHEDGLIRPAIFVRQAKIDSPGSEQKSDRQNSEEPGGPCGPHQRQALRI